MTLVWSGGLEQREASLLLVLVAFRQTRCPAAHCCLSQVKNITVMVFQFSRRVHDHTHIYVIRFVLTFDHSTTHAGVRGSVYGQTLSYIYLKLRPCLI